MTIKDAVKRFDVSDEVIERYISEGLIREKPGKTKEYEDADFLRIGLFAFLEEAGFNSDDIKKYRDGSCETRKRLLREKRRNTLDEVHGKQKLIDKIDYLINENK